MDPNSTQNPTPTQPQTNNYSQPENRITYPGELKTPSNAEKIIKIALIVLGFFIIAYTGVVVYQTQEAHKQADEPVPTPLSTNVKQNQIINNSKNSNNEINNDPNFISLPEVDEEGTDLNGRPKSSPAYYLNIIGPLNISIINSEGIEDSYGVNTQFLITHIPGISAYPLNSENSAWTFIIPPEQEVKITLDNEKDTPIYLELTYGTGEDTYLAIRYSDLILASQKKARLILTKEGVLPLYMSDKELDDFNEFIKPTSSVSGDSANDTEGPKINVSFEKINEQEYSTIVEAKDNSGVKKIYCSKNGTKFDEYKEPFTVSLKETDKIDCFADDNVGNRSGNYSFNITTEN